MDELSDPVVIGVVVVPHGVRGTLRVRALGPGRHLREGTEPVVAGMRRRISAARQTSKGFLLDLEGVKSRADAKALGGEELLLDRKELDEFAVRSAMLKLTLQHFVLSFGSFEFGGRIDHPGSV